MIQYADALVSERETSFVISVAPGTKPDAQPSGMGGLKVRLGTMLFLLPSPVADQLVDALVDALEGARLEALGKEATHALER